MADDMTVPAAVPSDAERLAALEAENAALRAKVASYEPAPAPIQEYPKWVTKRTPDSIERTLVADAAAQAALGEGWE